MTIDGYLTELERELRRRHAPRRRLLAEAADHLRSAADELAAEGLSAEEADRVAVARFGPAALVAKGYAHAVAVVTARRAVLGVAIAFAAYVVAAVAFAASAPSWLVDFPQGAPSALALQVAFVALGLSVLRALGGDGPLELVASGVVLAAGAVVVAAAAELVLAAVRPAPAPWHDAVMLVVIYGVAACAALAALPWAVRALRRASALEPTTDSCDVVVARHVARHPILSCALVAAAAGTAVFAAELTRTSAAGAGATALVEAAAVVIAYLALRRPLGLRPATTL
jgi:hypothetical protein